MVLDHNINEGQVLRDIVQLDNFKNNQPIIFYLNILKENGLYLNIFKI